MKKCLLAIGLVMMSVMAFSQDIQFTKGNIAPGKITTGKTFEDFLTGTILVAGKDGAAYSFIKATLVVLYKDGKKIKLELTSTRLNQEELKQVVKAGREGTLYRFENIVVKNSDGKKIKLPRVSYEFNLDATNNN